MHNGTNLPINPELLDILRDPYAIQTNPQHSSDPGRLELVRGSWLVSAETGYKYPIRDGIPVMLIEEGRKWQETAVEDLPVPPPAATPLTPTPNSATSAKTAVAFKPTTLAAVGVALLLIIILWRLLAKKP